MRDRLVHGYFHVRTAIVWATIREDPPGLRAAVSSILAEEEGR